MTKNQNFQDKIALITEGASGIGLATEKKLFYYSKYGPYRNSFIFLNNNFFKNTINS